MKRLLLVASALLLSAGVMAQEALQTRQGKSLKGFSQNTSALKKGFNPSPLVTYLGEDFASGIPGTWTVTDNSGGGEQWAYTTTGASSGAPGILSTVATTAANGYVIMDSDAGGQSTGPEDSDLLSPTFSCVGSSVVILTFNEYFQQYATSTGVVSVSNDGGATWLDYYDASAGLGQNQGTANPNAVILDISATAANQANVKIRFKYSGNWDWYWMVDDILVYEPAAVDAGVSYFVAPATDCGLSSNSQVTVNIRNYSNSNLSNFPVSVTVNGGAPLTENVATVIPPYGSINYIFSGTINLGTPGTYTLNAYTSATGDGNTANDATTASVDHVAAVNLSSPFTMGFEPGEDLSNWSVEDVNLDGVAWEVGAPSTTYTYAGIQCMRKPGSGAGAIPEDDDWLFTPCLDLVSGTTYAISYWFKNFELVNPCSLEVAVGNANISTAMGTPLLSNPVPTDTSYHNGTVTFTVPSNGVYYVGFHAYVTPGTGAGSSSLRLDEIAISQFTSIGEVSDNSGINVYPNPSTGFINIDIPNFRDAQVRIYNTLGHLVRTVNAQDARLKLDLTDLSAGIYLVEVSNDGFTSHRKITLQN